MESTSNQVPGEEGRSFSCFNVEKETERLRERVKILGNTNETRVVLLCSIIEIK